MLQKTLRSNLNFESTFDIFKSDALGCHQPAVLINCERLFNKFPTLGTCWNSHKIKMKTQKTNINRLFITTTPPEMWIFETRVVKSGGGTWWTSSSHFFPNLCSFLAQKAFYADFRRFVRFLCYFFKGRRYVSANSYVICMSIQNRALFNISSTICIERQICNRSD